MTLRIPRNHRSILELLLLQPLLLERLVDELLLVPVTFDILRHQRAIAKVLQESEFSLDIPDDADWTTERRVAQVLFALALASDSSEEDEDFADSFAKSLSTESRNVAATKQQLAPLLRLVSDASGENAFLLSALAAATLNNGVPYGSVELSLHAAQITSRGTKVVGSIPYHLARVSTTEHNDTPRKSLTIRLTDYDLKELRDRIDSMLAASESLLSNALILPVITIGGKTPLSAQSNDSEASKQGAANDDSA